MRVTPLSPIALLLSLFMSVAHSQNAPAAAAAAAAATKSTDAKPADAKSSETKASTPAAPTKPAATADAKKPSDTTGKTAATPPANDAKAGASKAAAASNPSSAADGKEPVPEKSAKSEGPPCVVAEFRAIGIDVQDVSKRRTQALNWLKQRAKQCSVEQLLMIRNNRSQWMGTADSASLASVVDSLLEAIAAENPRVAALLYGTPPPPPAGGDDKK